MKRPSMRIDLKNVKLADQTALRLAKTMRFCNIAILGIGNIVGCVSHQKNSRYNYKISKKLFFKIILN